MAKNNQLINSLKEIARRNRENNILVASERDTPQIYSVIAMALYNLFDTNEDEKVEWIEQVIAESQRIWNEAVWQNKDVIQMCEDLTGICMRYETNVKN